MQAHPRGWMYNRNHSNRQVLSEEFVQGVAEFIAQAKTLHPFVSGGTIRCPCMKCKCCKLLKPEDVKDHLYKKGFMNNYYVWTVHGETVGDNPPLVLENNVENSRSQEVDVDNFSSSHNEDEKCIDEAFQSAMRPLHGGTWRSKMYVAVRLLCIRPYFNIPEEAMDSIIELMNEVNPNIDLPRNYCEVKEVGALLGPPSPRSDGYDKGCDSLASKGSQKKSAQAKAAQASEKGGSLHIGGSVDTETHRRTREKKKGKNITYDEVFEEKCKKKRKNRQKLLVKPQALRTYVEGKQNVDGWLQSQPAGEVGAAASSSSQSRRYNNDEIEALRREIQKIEESVKKETKSRKRMARDIDRMEAKMTQIVTNGRSVVPSYPPSDSSDED